MIKGNPRKIKEYLPIDHCAEGIGYIKPKEGETIIRHDRRRRKDGKNEKGHSASDLCRCYLFFLV